MNRRELNRIKKNALRIFVATSLTTLVGVASYHLIKHSQYENLPSFKTMITDENNDYGFDDVLKENDKENILNDLINLEKYVLLSEELKKIDFQLDDETITSIKENSLNKSQPSFENITEKLFYFNNTKPTEQESVELYKDYYQLISYINTHSKETILQSGEFIIKSALKSAVGGELDEIRILPENQIDIKDDPYTKLYYDDREYKIEGKIDDISKDLFAIRKNDENLSNKEILKYINNQRKSIDKQYEYKSTFFNSHELLRSENYDENKKR